MPLRLIRLESPVGLVDHLGRGGGQGVELGAFLLGLLERPADLGQLGQGQYRLAVFLAGLVVPLAELGQQDGDPVDFLVVPGPVGQDLGDAEPDSLLVEVVRRSAVSPAMAIR